MTSRIAATARATGRVFITTDDHAFDDLPAVQHRLAARNQPPAWISFTRSV